MSNFKNFELNNTDMIFGGELIDTHYSGRGGDSGGDIYDTEMDRVIYTN